MKKRRVSISVILRMVVSDKLSVVRREYKCQLRSIGAKRSITHNGASMLEEYE